MTSSENNKSNFGLPDMTALSESERLQVLAVMQRAKVNKRTSSHCCITPDFVVLEIAKVVSSCFFVSDFCFLTGLKTIKLNHLLTLIIWALLYN